MNQISVQELKNIIDQGQSIQIIDVREMNEIEEVNIGAQALPLSQLNTMDYTPIEDWNKEEPIYVHCRSGMRSMQACLILETLGFQNTINVEGGIMAWLQNYGDQKL